MLTQTATVHAEAWKCVFDAYLRERATQTDEPLVPFDPVDDHDRFADGKPRLDGVRALASRAIELPAGAPGDPPDAATIAALGPRKNTLVLRLIRERGVAPYEGSVRFVRAARAAGLRTAVVSSSTHCREVLIAAGIEGLFEERIDGLVVERRHLRGKPAPDTFLAAARALDIPPARAAVFEDLPRAPRSVAGGQGAPGAGRPSASGSWPAGGLGRSSAGSLRALPHHPGDVESARGAARRPLRREHHGQHGEAREHERAGAHLQLEGEEIRGV